MTTNLQSYKTSIQCYITEKGCVDLQCTCATYSMDLAVVSILEFHVKTKLFYFWRDTLNTFFFFFFRINYIYLILCIVKYMVHVSFKCLSSL